MIEPKNINRRPTKFWHLRLLGEGWEEACSNWPTRRALAAPR